uniref:Uncharacterized protein n=1 Tax=Oryza sativa subsp. japonica TaxID=39947 RepID=Q6YZ38_ORYSJ|nr:hypothetical protein [Oryza sativa Japonica Group]
MGGKREVITGNISPLLIARGTDGSGGIRGGGGARARARRRERREEGDDGWAPPVSEGGGQARPKFQTKYKELPVRTLCGDKEGR